MGNTTSTTTTQVDPTIQPYLSYGLGEAQKLYQAGGPQYYSGQTYVAPSQTTQTGLQALEQRAMQGNPLVGAAQGAVQGAIQGQQSPAAQMYANIYGQAGFNPTSQFFSGMMGGTQNPAMAGYGNLRPGTDAGAQVFSQLAYGNNINPALSGLSNLRTGYDPGAAVANQIAYGSNVNPAMQGTQQTASGAFLGGNQFFQGAFAPAAQAATQQFQTAIGDIGSAASKAGRYGSGAMGTLQDRASSQLAKSLSDTAGQLAYQNYAQERGMQEAAQGRLGALSQQEIANRMAAGQTLTGSAQNAFNQQLAQLQAVGGLSQQEIANRMAAAQGLSNVSQTAFNQQLSQLQGIGNLSQQDIANRMAAAQGLGSNYQQSLATQLAATGGVGQTYASDIGRQLTAAGMAPGLAQSDYQDIQNLLAAGQAREGYTGQQLQSDIARFNFGQQAPQQNLATFLSSVYGNPMSTLKSTTASGTTSGPSTFQNLLGLAAVGGGLYKNVGGAPGIQSGYNALTNWLGGFGGGSSGGSFVSDPGAYAFGTQSWE